MRIEGERRRFARIVSGGTTLAALTVATVLVPDGEAWGQDAPELIKGIEETESAKSYTHMAEELRSDIRKVVVIAGRSPADREVKGTYEKDTQGLLEGIDSGSRIGTISKEVGGVPVYIPIPILTIPGAIYGGLSAATKREIQEFRDALTDELVNAGDRSLHSDGLALDVFWGLRNLPNLQSELFAATTPLPEDADAVLYVSLYGVSIDVQGKEAIITTAAGATLHRLSDRRDLYRTVVQYQDRDTLGSWTRNENALWRDYTNFARHYLGRELSAEAFDRIELRHELVPEETDTADRARKNERLFESRSLAPTLAWNLELQGGDPQAPWSGTIDESDISYAVEIYDAHQLVYAEEQIQDPSHTLLMELEPCGTYRWSVRPTYHVGGDVKFGEWMRFGDEAETITKTGKAIFGRQASDTPAYIQDFALLEIHCKAK